MAIYQACSPALLRDRAWCFIGAGESDGPESLGSTALVGREGLDNLIFVVSCNPPAPRRSPRDRALEVDDHGRWQLSIQPAGIHVVRDATAGDSGPAP
jgi:hypothetical protein